MTDSKVDSYTGGHNAMYHTQIDKKTTMKNQNRKAALGRPAMKLLGASTSFRSTTSPLVLHRFLRHLVVWFAWKIPNS